MTEESRDGVREEKEERSGAVEEMKGKKEEGEESKKKKKATRGLTPAILARRVILFISRT